MGGDRMGWCDVIVWDYIMGCDGMMMWWDDWMWWDVMMGWDEMWCDGIMSCDVMMSCYVVGWGGVGWDDVMWMGWDDGMRWDGMIWCDGEMGWDDGMWWWDRVYDMIRYDVTYQYDIMSWWRDDVTGWDGMTWCDVVRDDGVGWDGMGGMVECYDVKWCDDWMCYGDMVWCDDVLWIWIWINSQQKTSIKSITLTRVLREGGRGLGAGTLQLGQLWLETGNGLSFCYAGW